MTITTLTSKGQITIPREIRTELGLVAGDRVEFMKNDDGHYTILAATQSVRGLKGLMSHPSQPAVTIEAMNAAIAAQGARAKSVVE